MPWQRLKTTQKVPSSPGHSATLSLQSFCAGFPTHSLPEGTAPPVLNNAPHVSTNDAPRVGTWPIVSLNTALTSARLGARGCRSTVVPWAPLARCPHSHGLAATTAWSCASSRGLAAAQSPR